ncbi:MAG: T9SS type A sorting domain-containing protein [Ignavibacteria bacterium]|jgi:hypothetical protein
MKNKIILSVALLFLFLSNGLVAQTYTCTIENQVVIGTDFKFDIYMQRTDATEIYLGHSEFSLVFNNVNFTSPTVSYVAGTASLANWYTLDAAIPSPGIVKFTVGALFFQNDQSNFDARVCKPLTTAPGTHIATITITGISNPEGDAGLLWRLDDPHDSKVNTYAPSDPWGLSNITANGTYTNPTGEPLPVELSVFTAKIINETNVALNWKTETEVDNYGFEIQRRTNKDDPTHGWIIIGFINGNGNSNSPKTYSFVDKNPPGSMKFIYRLKQIDLNGQYKFSDEVEIDLVPTKYGIYQNYPNPFNPNTYIKFSLPEDAKVSIRIYSMLGELVNELVNKNYEAGYHKVEFNAIEYASGVYIYRIIAGNFVESKKMIILK